MFSHERLKVYDKALISVATLARFSALWDKRHSVVDHLLRASESIVLNLAEGARLWGVGEFGCWGASLRCCIDCHSVQEIAHG